MLSRLLFLSDRQAVQQLGHNLAEVVQQTMDEVAPYIGRQYKVFEYVGAPDAEEITVLMGSGSTTVNEAVDVLVSRGKKVGAVLVHLYRPWSSQMFEACLPKSVKRIAVLDRCKEVTAIGEPLYLDVAATLNLFSDRKNIVLIGGRYGLGSKDFIPEHALAVYANLAAAKPIPRFTVGINDDVTLTSVPYVTERVDTLPEGSRLCPSLCPSTLVSQREDLWFWAQQWMSTTPLFVWLYPSTKMSPLGMLGNFEVKKLPE